MPIRRRYTARRRTRKTTSNRKKFSKFSTYKNRSSKAQANQIYQLNKRISRVEKKTKPEYLHYDSNLIDFDTLADGTWSYHNKNLLTNAANENMKDKIVGDKFKLVKLQIYGFIKRRTNLYGALQLPNDMVNTFNQPSFYGIFIIGLTPKATSDSPLITQFVDFDSVVDQPDLIYKAPLKPGCKSLMKILKVKKFKITNNDVECVPFKISIPLKFRTCTKTPTDVFTANNPLLLYTVCQNADLTPLNIQTQQKSIFDIQYKYRVYYTDN